MKLTTDPKSWKVGDLLMRNDTGATTKTFLLGRVTKVNKGHRPEALETIQAIYDVIDAYPRTRYNKLGTEEYFDTTSLAYGHNYFFKLKDDPYRVIKVLFKREA